MLTKPDLADDQLIARVAGSYGITARKLEYLPLGQGYFITWLPLVE